LGDEEMNFPPEPKKFPSQKKINGGNEWAGPLSLAQSLLPKDADFGGFIGKEGVIFFNKTLQESY
jgi:hypothetical protein